MSSITRTVSVISVAVGLPLVGSVYGSRLRVGGIVHCVHRPHNFPQLVHLIFRQRRYGGALLITRNIRRKDHQDILPTNEIHIIVGCNVLAVMLYRVGDCFQSVAVFCCQGFYCLLHGNCVGVGGIGGKKDAIGRAGHKGHKADDIFFAFMKECRYNRAISLKREGFSYGLVHQRRRI